MRCSYQACYFWFIFMAYTQKYEGGGVRRNAQGNEEGLQGHTNMVRTQWYKDSPLSVFGFCEWNPSLSVLLGLPISKRRPGQSPHCSMQRFKHVCKWACFSSLNRPGCAEPEVKHIRTAWLGHYLVGSVQHCLGLVTEQGSCDTETKSLCFSPHRAMLCLFVTHVRSNRRHVPRRRNCLAGWPSESAGDLPNLCELWL